MGVIYGLDLFTAIIMSPVRDLIFQSSDTSVMPSDSGFPKEIIYGIDSIVPLGTGKQSTLFASLVWL